MGRICKCKWFEKFEKATGVAIQSDTKIYQHENELLLPLEENNLGLKGIRIPRLDKMTWTRRHLRMAIDAYINRSHPEPLMNNGYVFLVSEEARHIYELILQIDKNAHFERTSFDEPYFCHNLENAFISRDYHWHIESLPCYASPDEQIMFVWDRIVNIKNNECICNVNVDVNMGYRWNGEHWVEADLTNYRNTVKNITDKYDIDIRRF